MEWWPKPTIPHVEGEAVEQFFADFFQDHGRPVLATGLSANQRACLRLLADNGRIRHTARGWVRSAS